MRDNENSSRASDRICTNILEASPRAMSKCDFVEITKYGSWHSPLCQEGQTAVRRMPRSHVRHRLVRGSDSNNCVLSRLGASLLQLFLRSTCSLLSMFAFQVIRPCTFSGSSHRGVDRSRHAQDYSSSSVVSTLSRRGLLTSRAAIVAPRTPEGDKLTSRAAVVAPRTPEGD
jgi:hypothetical protein